MKEIGAGIIIWRKKGKETEFFLCTPGGPKWLNRECWNFPKGHMVGNETPFETAVREFTEETSIKPSTDERDYVYHGLIKQRKGKSVHVYSKKWSGEKLGDNCYSNTFEWTDGKEYPEIGEYKWMTLQEVVSRGGVKAYYTLFNSIANKNDIECNGTGVNPSINVH